MLLTKSQVKNFRSVDDSTEVQIDPDITVLVGQNESGKTAFLEALHRTNPIKNDVKFDIEKDYPRKGMTTYRKTHKENPAVAVKATFELSENEIRDINTFFEFELLKEFIFTVEFKYDGEKYPEFTVDELPYIGFLLKNSSLTSETKKAVEKSITVKELLKLLEEADLNEKEQLFTDDLKSKFGNSEWENAVEYKLWDEFLLPNLPKFFYFSDYQLLPGKINLTTLKNSLSNPEGTPSDNKDLAVLSLLSMAGITLEDLLDESGYESNKASLESISNSITDQIFDYWTQNNDLEVKFDVLADPAEKKPPFNTGKNLYIRIYNQKHRVSVPFDQRSKGFIWFFSFIVWFDEVKQLIREDKDVILLLDEPGLSLHAMAQADLLRYIDVLTEKHQVIYTTHSPFMVRQDRLNQARTVQDEVKVGTKVSGNLTSADPKTLFPLQAALGYDIAQNLFISKRNLLVEGPADLIYLNYFSALLEAKGRESLRDDLTIIPAGGLDKIVTFIALLGGNKLEFVVLHDYNKQPDQRLTSLINEKLIKDKKVLNYATFRQDTKSSNTNKQQIKLLDTDVEDLISPKHYLEIFNRTYGSKLNNPISETVLTDNNDRIVIRLEKYLEKNSINVRPSGGFNHYAVAQELLSSKSPEFDDETLARFESLFKEVNKNFE